MSKKKTATKVATTKSVAKRVRVRKPTVKRDPVPTAEAAQDTCCAEDLSDFDKGRLKGFGDAFVQIGESNKPYNLFNEAVSELRRLDEEIDYLQQRLASLQQQRAQLQEKAVAYADLVRAELNHPV
jgi:hypothetical protein